MYTNYRFYVILLVSAILLGAMPIFMLVLNINIFIAFQLVCNVIKCNNSILYLSTSLKLLGLFHIFTTSMSLFALVWIGYNIINKTNIMSTRSYGISLVLSMGILVESIFMIFFSFSIHNQKNMDQSYIQHINILIIYHISLDILLTSISILCIISIIYSLYINHISDNIINEDIISGDDSCSNSDSVISDDTQ